MMGVSKKMLTLYRDDIKRDLPGLLMACANYHPGFIDIVSRDVQELMKANKMKFEQSGVPTFRSISCKDGKHKFTYDNPYMVVVCRQYNKRMIVQEIWHEFNYID